ncbi:uncharacterized protein LOC115073750 [Rhinatrema bivittatum]|uniref:uncharacterized protein LOC115073750 n=1 Tax=Rhinatrema bivittatum TaxID=194408 RepID=UPI001129BB83|nr:uncharacterized protein LOC115073750 [Rhinatrema bivittatum]
MAQHPSSLGLLADYESESEEESMSNEGSLSRSCKKQIRASPGLGVNCFQEDAGSSKEDSRPLPERCVDYLPETRLPAPRLEAATGTDPLQACVGVFANPFRDEQKAQLSLLERHVQLTASERPSEIAGRKICHAYRKDGRCRFGSSCKFAHDSDLQVLPMSRVTKEIMTTPAAAPSTDQQQAGSEDGQPARGKRKPGLSSTLIPPKRTMKSYQAQLAKDRPWVL